MLDTDITLGHTGGCQYSDTVDCWRGMKSGSRDGDPAELDRWARPSASMQIAAFRTTKRAALTDFGHDLR